MTEISRRPSRKTERFESLTVSDLGVRVSMSLDSIRGGGDEAKDGSEAGQPSNPGAIHGSDVSADGADFFREVRGQEPARLVRRSAAGGGAAGNIWG